MSIHNVKAVITLAPGLYSVGWGSNDVAAVLQAAENIEGDAWQCKLVVGTQYSNEFSVSYVTTLSKWEADTGHRFFL